MMKFYGNKGTVVEFVNALLLNSKIDWQSITITNPGRSGESFVAIATDILSEDTVKELAEIYFNTL